MLAFIMARRAGSKVRQLKDIFFLPWYVDGGDVFGRDSSQWSAEPDYSYLERLKAKGKGKGKAVLMSGVPG